MTLKAPIDGTVYYGRFVRGKWSGLETLADILRPGGIVQKNVVVMTIVEPKPLFVRCTVPEADLDKVRRGMKGSVRPVAFPEARLAGTVTRVEPVPTAAESFEVRVELKPDDKAPALVPGMACAAKFVPYLDKQALLAPAKAVFTDDVEEDKSYVFVTTDGGKTSAKRPVVVGKRSDDQVEIVRGLAEGESILLERPKDAAPAPDAAKPAPPEKKPAK